MTVLTASEFTKPLVVNSAPAGAIVRPYAFVWLLALIVSAFAVTVIVPTTNRGTETTLEEKSSGLCPTAACFGQLSQLTIPGLAGSDTVVVFVRWDDSAIPSGITQRNLRVA